MKHMSETVEGGSSAEDGTGGKVEHGVERDQTVETVDHGVNFRLIGVGFHLEEDDVLDGGGRRHGGFDGEGGFQARKAFVLGRKESGGKWGRKE